MRNLWPLTTLQAIGVVAAILLAGCHSSSESARQARVESISTAKAGDVAYLASRSSGGSSDLVKTAAIGTSSPGEASSPAAPQTGSTSSGTSARSKTLGAARSSDRVALPADNRSAPGDSADKGPADVF